MPLAASANGGFLTSLGHLGLAGAWYDIPPY